MVYRNNYSILNGVQTYYSSIPDYLKVRDHQFVDWQVVALWTSSMLLSWTSATNSAQVYDLVLLRLAVTQPIAKFKLCTKHVWDGFLIHTLLNWHMARCSPLCVLHVGKQKDRFKEVMCSRNKEMERAGQPEFAHYCDKCTRRIVGQDGITGAFFF